MKKPRVMRVLSLSAALLTVSSAQAHAPYLLPNLFDLGKRDHVTVQASFTEEFFSPDVVMKSDDYHVVTPAGAKVPLTPVYARDLALVEADTKEAGTYRISGLEYRALSHPSSAFVGSEVKFEVLFDGKPLARHAVSVYGAKALAADQKPFVEVTADKEGRFSFKPSEPGVYLAMSRHRPTPPKDSQQGVSYTYSVVLEATE